MNPSQNETPGNQLPPPIMEQAPHANNNMQPAQPSHEQSPAARAEQSQAPRQAAPQLSSIPLPAMQQAQQSMQNDVSTTTNSSAAASTDDSDLIEKEWVVKAKAIVDRNREDPYKQTEELTAVKADYMKQRYNKVIKLNK